MPETNVAEPPPQVTEPVLPNPVLPDDHGYGEAWYSGTTTTGSREETQRDIWRD